LKAGVMPTTFLTMADVDNLCRVSGYERVRVRQAVYVPWRLLGIGSIVNRLMPAIPLVKHLALTNIIVLRPLIDDVAPRLTLSIVVPARNERGNIGAAIQRLPKMSVDVEVIFVEGHSSDGTWEEIERVAEEGRANGLAIRTFRQTGKGKADAVRLGFANASGDLLTILDADLTMPPELLPRFVDAYLSGAADFINGSRIVYPMEGEAMRFLNRLGNVFFAKALTSVLGVRLGDSLCGTKLMRRDDYQRMIEWRRDFGDFDPFGDFELLFPAAVLALGMVDVPIRYRARTYGETQISRFSHGFMLLRMTIIGFFRIKLGRTRLMRG
jgi:glycosyltransferase involved in cell wall biosynthesis